MAINITKINKTSAETKSAIQRKSAQSLPNNPSERGYSAEEIKRRFYQPIIDATNSAIAEVDRIAEETNIALEDVGVQFDAYMDNTQIKEAYRIIFDNQNWVYNEENGMYEIVISNKEHGIGDYEKIGVDMFLLDGNGAYIPVNQYEIQLDGTVRCYHESNGAGHVSIYEKREGVIIAQGVVDVNNVVGLAKVALTNDYNDLDNIPDNNLAKSNELKISEILSGIRKVAKAQQADNATNAVYAQNCDSATNASNAVSATKASQDGDGNVIKNTYAKQNGTYSAMSVGSATRASQDGAGNNIVSNYAKKDGSYENMSVGSAIKANQDSEGNIIKDTYATKNGSYDNMIVGNAIYAQYASEDTSKGTIEERLTNLGFKQGSVIMWDYDYITATHNELKRQGNYVLCHLILSWNDPRGGGTLFTLPDGFKISSEYAGNLEIAFAAWNDTNLDENTFDIAGKIAQRGADNKDEFSLSYFKTTDNPIQFELIFGYEAEPLT